MPIPKQTQFHIETTPTHEELSNDMDYQLLSDEEEKIKINPIAKNKEGTIKQSPIEKINAIENQKQAINQISNKKQNQSELEQFYQKIRMQQHLLEEDLFTFKKLQNKNIQNNFSVYIKICGHFLDLLKHKSITELERDPDNGKLISDDVIKDYRALKHDIFYMYELHDDFSPIGHYYARQNLREKFLENKMELFQENLVRLNKLIEHKATQLKTFRESYQPILYPEKFRHIDSHDNPISKAMQIFKDYIGPEANVLSCGNQPDTYSQKISVFWNNLLHPRHHHRDKAKKLVDALNILVPCKNFWTNQRMPLTSEQLLSAIAKVKEVKYFLITSEVPQKSDFLKRINFVLENLLNPGLHHVKTQNQLLANTPELKR